MFTDDSAVRVTVHRHDPLPDLLSQKNVEKICGIPPRTYLETLPAYRTAGGHVSHVGKLRIVVRADFVRYVASLDMPEKKKPEQPVKEEGLQEVAAGFGLRVLEGGR